MDKQQLLDKITTFINGIGIPCTAGEVEDGTFLPGVDIKNGGIIFNADKMLSPGDLLHEAGHIAVLTEADRKVVSSPDVSGDLQEGGAEMAAIAWSWAALKHLDIPPGVVFHETGYHGDSENIINNFSKGNYFGASMLQWLQMTVEQHHAKDGDAVYPDMKRWLR